MSASAFIFVTLVFCFVYVKVIPHDASETKDLAKQRMTAKAFIGWIVCFTATVQLMFLPSILPNVFQVFHFKENLAVKSAGLVVMLYTVTAMAGTYLLCRMTTRVTAQRLIIIAGVLGTVMQLLMSLSPGIFSFVAVRMLQTGLIAAVMPLVFATFSTDLDGRVIGFLNSSRFAGNALGPMIAGSVLAFSSLSRLYLFIGSLSLLVMAGYAFSLSVARNKA